MGLKREKTKNFRWIDQKKLLRKVGHCAFKRRLLTVSWGGFFDIIEGRYRRHEVVRISLRYLQVYPVEAECALVPNLGACL